MSFQLDAIEPTTGRNSVVNRTNATAKGLEGQVQAHVGGHQLRRYPRDRLLDFWGTNPTKERYTTGQSGVNEFCGAPREFGVRAKVEF